MKDYKYLTEREHKVKLEEEDNKDEDPCEEGMECMQDKEIRKKVKIVEELNWKHKDKIPEAEGPTISPDRKWIPGRTQEQEQTNENNGTKYDPLEAFKQRKNREGKNPVDLVRALRILKEKEEQEAQGWQAVQQQKIRKCMETQFEREEAQDWKIIQQHKIRKCMVGQFETEDKMEALREERIQEGLNKIQQVEAKKAEEKENDKEEKENDKEKEEINSVTKLVEEKKAVAIDR